VALTPGTRLGPYEVTAQIGVGGMGEVYRATDANLERQVAIKVLPQAFAQDADRLARFEREAKTLASLNHTNIAQIYGLERSHGTTALVMELVEGPTLADRIAQGPIPLDEALPIAKQMAEALEAAHEQGIIHRDLKPANIKLRPDGTVKVLDFGLAKLAHPAAAPGSADVTASPTITSPAMMTGVGVLLGTAAYMSPEQAKGREADKRSDIWAFGCVLYEMLTGKRAFNADDMSETLAAVLRAEVDWNLLPVGMSPVVRTFLARCLQKDPKQRIADVQDIRLALDGAFDTKVAPADVAGTVARPLWQRALPIALAVGVAASVTAVALLSRPSVPGGNVVRSSIVLPAVSYGSRDPVAAVSPDGTTLIYAGPDRLYRRELSRLAAQPVSGTEGASQPFFSPDGMWLGFVDRTGNLRKVSLSGEPPITILSLPPQQLFGGASWGTDGQILVGRMFDGLYKVSANGGTSESVTSLGADEALHLGPQHLPGGAAALFTIIDGQGGYHVAVVSLETGKYHRIAAGSSPRYLSSGHLVFLRDGRLWAVPFDVQRLAMTGEPVAVLEDIHSYLTTGHFAVGGPTGSLVYARRSDVHTELRWIDRDGVTLKVAGRINGLIRNFDLNHDDRRLAFSSAAVAGDLWLYDIERNVTTKLLGVGADANWSSDGRRVAYAEGFIGRISAIASEGGAPTVLFQRKDGLVWLDDWSRVGDRLAVHLQGGRNRGLVLTARGDSEPIVFDEAEGLDEAEFSPDGKWIAYNGNHGGGQEVWVVPFPPTGERIQVSSGGGVQPQWRSDGKELFYLSFTGMLMGVPIDTTTGFRPGIPTTLFETGLAADSGVEQYAVGSNGSRFLFPTPVGASSEASLVLIQNWFEELKRLVPTK
jgi:Tol biopolymer transport system component